MPQGEHADVAVVGAGFGGLALGSVCADAGLSVTILERREELAPEGVALVLAPNGLTVLERLGVLEEVLAAGQRITSVRQCNAAGRTRARVEYAELGHRHSYLVLIERAALVGVLAARLPETVQLRTGCATRDLVREDGAVLGVRYADATGAVHELRADCTVGADGSWSRVRDELGPRLRWQTGPDRYLIGLSPAAPADPAATLFCGRGWCNGVMPLRGRTYFFDHLTGPSGEAYERGDFDGWRELYARKVPGGERIVAGLTSFEDDAVGVLSGRTHLATPRTAPGAALLGDAAAAVHPHNGQGANLALEDALVLGDALAEHGPAGRGALAEYERTRQAKLRRQVPWSIMFGRTLDGGTPGWRAMRRMGYVVARVPPARRATTRQQAGIG